jgi:gluconate 2-dehydrogenase
MHLPKILITRAIFPEVAQRLAQHFSVESNDADADWSADDIARRLKDKTGALTFGLERIDADLLARCPHLKICANMTVGYNNFDLDAMTRCRRAGHQCTRRADRDHRRLRFCAADGHGTACDRERAFFAWPENGRAGSTRCSRVPRCMAARLGIIGMGRIGQAIARRAAFGFGMKVVYHNRSRLDPATEANCRASYLSKQELLQTADHVMLVVPYSAGAHHTIGCGGTGLMKPTATLINIARGGIVDDAALAAALRDRRIAAAGLDVYEGEPQGPPRPADCAQCGADAAYRQRYSGYAPRHGHARGGQPDWLPGSRQGCHRFECRRLGNARHCLNASILIASYTYSTWAEARFSHITVAVRTDAT